MTTFPVGGHSSLFGDIVPTTAQVSAITASIGAALAVAIPAAPGQLFAGSSTAGSFVPITLGTNLSLSGTTLNAVGGGGAAGVTSFNGNTGPVTLSSSDVTTALGYTPYSNSNPSGYQTASQVSSAISSAAYSITNPSGYQTASQVSSAISAAAYSLPTASTTTLGGVKVDGSTVTISGGVISASTSYSLPTASTTVLGGVKVDGTSITISGGVISANTSGGVTLAVGGTDPVPVIDGTASVGTSGKAAREDHVHPTDTSRAPTASPTLTGTIGLGTNTTTATVGINGPSGATRALLLQTAGGNRWLALATSTAESGSNVGSDFNLSRYDDTGTFIDTPLAITRSTGQITVGSLTATTLTVGANAVLTTSTGLQKSNNLSDVASAATARSNLGVAACAWVTSFDQGAVVANGTITVVRKAPFACTINSLDYEVGSAGGSFTVAVQIAGTNVTGLSAVAVSSATSANATATAANSVSAGQAVTIVISGTTGSPTGAILQLNATR